MTRALRFILGALAGLIIVLGPEAPAGATPVISGPGYIYLDHRGPTACGDGWDCNWVWDPAINWWIEADLYNCGTYYLSNWASAGYVNNSQYGSVMAYSMDRTGHFYQGWMNDHGIWSASWDPAWAIKPC